MAARDPLTDVEKSKIRELHAAGKSRNDIARELGRGMNTISRACAAMQLDFVRTRTAAATEARKQDAKAMRAQLMIDLLADADRLRQQMFEPAHAFNFGGKDNDYNERTLTEPTFADKRNIVQAVSTAVSTSIRLDEHDRVDETLTEVDAWLAAMMGVQ